jgi:hypothetical protein
VKAWSAAVLLLGLAVAGAGVLALGRTAEAPPAPKKAGPAAGADGKADEKADPAKRLAAARLDAAKAAYEGYRAAYEAGFGTEEAVHLWSRRWLQAQLDVSDDKDDREAALAAYHERLKKTDEIARARMDLGNSPPLGLEPRGRDDGQGKYDEKFEAAWKAYQHSTTSEEEVCLASVRWLMYQHLLSKLNKNIDPKDELQAHLDRVKKVEAIARLRCDAGKTAPQDCKTATFFRVQAEEWLAQGKTFKEEDVTPGAPPK